MDKDQSVSMVSVPEEAKPGTPQSESDYYQEDQEDVRI